MPFPCGDQRVTLISILTMNGCPDLTLESDVSYQYILTDPHPDLLDS
jgi:hypothetical protein